MAPTRDSLWGGRLLLWQPGRGEGYRFNLDPVLLAGFVRPAARLLDLGTGCGVIALLLLARGTVERATGVERQGQLAALARRNAEENGLGGRCSILHGDLRELDLPAVDAVVFNPPYFRLDEGRPSPIAGREAARREHHGGLDAFVAAAERALTARGSLYAIVRARRDMELEAQLERHGFRSVRRRSVASHAGRAPQHLLVEARRLGDVGDAAPLLEPPLVVHGEGGERFSPEVLALLDPAAR